MKNLEIKDSNSNDHSSNSNNNKDSSNERSDLRQNSQNPRPEPTRDPVEKTEAQSPPKKPFNMGLAVGSATINDTIYNQVALRPEFSFGKLGIGLDLVLYIDNEGNVRKDEWDEASDFIDKLLYIRWGQKI